jgi:acetylornithine/succinyldiaminopimelate/putrescine aminotransferase
VNKVTLCNYVTPAVVRATEWVASLAPAQPHLYLTSSRDETFDKAVRALRVNRPEGQVVIGLEGGYVGHTTGAARSLSDPRVHRQGPGYFRGWPRLPHPARDPRETVRALRDAVQQAGGPEKVLGLFVEPLQERTGRALPDGFGAELDALRDELGLPVVFVETASASYRSGRGPFHGGGGFEPDLRIWWGGGQVGFVHVAPGLFVETPLTLVSTWDGDELSLVRVHHQLRAARHVDVSALSGKLDEALGPATEAGMVVQGRGLFRVVEANDKAPPIAAALAHRGVRVRVHPQGALSIIPPLDVSTSQLETFAEVFAKALAEAER